MHDEFEVGFVFVFGAETREELVHEGVVGGELAVVLLGQVDEDARVDAGHAVEDGLGQVHLPFVLPRTDDVLHFCFCVDDSVVADQLAILTDLLLVHGEDVQRLVELYPLAFADVLRVVLVYHLPYIIRESSIPE